MNKLWDYLKGHLNKEDQISASIPFLHEVIDEASFPVSDFIEWRDEEHHQLIKQRLRQAYFNFRAGGDPLDQAFEFMDNEKSNGFVIFHRPSYTLSTSDYLFFQYAIVQVLKDHNYIINLADIRSQQKSNRIEKTFRYYLKPSARLRTKPKAQQIFGNISIEFTQRDETPFRIRVIANYYQDQHFATPLEFREFIAIICQ